MLPVFPGLGSGRFLQNTLCSDEEVLILVAFSARLQCLGRGEAALPGSELISGANYLCPNLRRRYCFASEGGPVGLSGTLISFRFPRHSAMLICGATTNI